MNTKQLEQIKIFSKRFYNKTGRYHGWDHILLTRYWAMRISKGIKNADTKILQAACYLHDIGRTVKDEGHPDISVKLATPFLRKIKISEDDIGVISEAISCHDVKKIGIAKRTESRILFDADKMQILSVFGFIRVINWLTDERKMDLNAAVEFLWKYCLEVRKKYIYTGYAKRVIDKDFKTLKILVKRYFDWQNI